MRYLWLVFLVACSSAEKKQTATTENISNDSFKKEKPLSEKQVKDYYVGPMKSSSPALQDETLDRMTGQELASVKVEGDPLTALAVQCARGEFESAFNLAAQSFNKYQKIPMYWNLVANCHLNQGNHRKALLFYNKALEVSPDYAPALNNIGVIFTRQGQDQKALVAFERASKSSRFSKTPRYNLAKLYLSYGLADQALPVLRSLLDDSPDDVDLLNSVASANFLQGKYQEAFSYFNRIPKEHWSSAEIGLNYALTLSRLNRPKDAATIFNNVKVPEHKELREYHAVVRGQLGEKK